MYSTFYSGCIPGFSPYSATVRLPQQGAACTGIYSATPKVSVGTCARLAVNQHSLAAICAQARTDTFGAVLYLGRSSHLHVQSQLRSCHATSRFSIQGSLSSARSGYLRSATSSKNPIQRFRNPLPLTNSQRDVLCQTKPACSATLMFCIVKITGYSLSYCFCVPNDTQVPP